MATSNSQLASAIMAAIGSTQLFNYVNVNFRGGNGATPSLADCAANASCTLVQVQNAFVLAVSASQVYYHFPNTSNYFTGSNTLNTANTIATALASTPHHRIGSTLNSLT